MRVHLQLLPAFAMILSTMGLMVGCNSTSSTAATVSPYAFEQRKVVTIDDRAFKGTVQKNLDKLITETAKYTPHTDLKKQLSRKSCKLDLPMPGYFTLRPSEIYERALKSTIAIGVTYHCKSSKCKKNHVNLASGVIIRSDGIVLTNYHVVDSSQPKLMGMAAATQDGSVYLVDEILAASKKDDVVILRLKGANHLPAVPIYRDEPVGNPVTVVSHPVGQFYTLTQGYVSRYAANRGHRVLNITADYAKGSSGGPLFNNRGDLIGLVASTRSISYTTVPLSVCEDEKTLSLTKKGDTVAKVQGKPLILQSNHQMTVKNCVPSAQVLDLVKSEK